MNKALLSGLIVLGLTVIVLLFNATGKMDLNLVFDTVAVNKALGLLAFTTVGVSVGLLLK
jgi:hypothetical protein